MKARFLAVALAAASTFAALPAAAQVNGIAVTDPAVAIAASQALQTAYNQIGTTYQAQRTQIEGLQQQRTALLRQFDTNNDGQLSDQEQAAAQADSAKVQQLQGFDQQINQAQQPITAARVYVVEQLLMQYNAALQQVVSQNSVQLVLSPASVVWLAPTADITQKITTALNQLAPTVSTSVPQGWQPQRQSAAIFQEVQDVLVSAAVQAQAQQQAQQPAAAAPAQQGR